MDTKLIPLTKGRFAIVDVEDFQWLSQKEWQVHDKSKISYALGKKWLSHTKGITLAMHREIFKRHNINIEGMDIDHINGNGLDNRKNNLRRCTNQENQFNTRSHKIGSSGYKGVSWNKVDKKWQVYLRTKSKVHFCGQFKDKKSAAIAYDLMAKKLHGNFANLNFKPKDIE